MSEPCYDAKYLVLHFLGGVLVATAVVRSWRGAQMSKHNHENLFRQGLSAAYGPSTRILPIDEVLAIPGVEKPDANLSDEDVVLLRKMGIDA